MDEDNSYSRVFYAVLVIAIIAAAGLFFLAIFATGP